MTPGPWEDYTYASVRRWPDGSIVIEVNRNGREWHVWILGPSGGRKEYMDLYVLESDAVLPQTREDVKRRADRAAANLFSIQEST